MPSVYLMIKYSSVTAAVTFVSKHVRYALMASVYLAGVRDSFCPLLSVSVLCALNVLDTYGGAPGCVPSV